jgi:ABC-type multidrug transport system ATPase subunit
MYAFLTVFETLMISADFFLPGNVTKEDKIANVEFVMAELGLSKTRDVIIGNDKARGISGGERKRVSIAVQLLTDPAVLFLDEPTSGLDAFQSLAVMEALKKLAENGRLVMTVIHQPRSSIYEMLDKLLVLSEGRLMYHDETQKAVEYFAHLGHACPESFNPADFFLDILSPDNRSKESEQATTNRIKFVGDKWEEHSRSPSSSTHPLGEKNNNNNEDTKNIEEFQSVKMIGGVANWEKTSRNLGLLFWRSFIQQARDIPTTTSKILPAIFFALLIGGLYSNIGNSQHSIMNRKGVLYFILINQSFISVVAVIAAFPTEKLIVGREKTGGAYTTLPYCLAKMLVELPINIFPIVVYCCVIYP